MDIKFVLPRGRGVNRLRQMSYFSSSLIDLCNKIGMKLSSRGWCYQLEGFRLIDKSQFDLVENIINECRELGFLPIDFVAEEEARGFSGVEKPEEDEPKDFLGRFLVGALTCEQYYTPDWWEGEEYYIQMVVEKIDVKTLFEPVCREYHIPIATCYDDETEVMTDNGWKNFADLKYTQPCKIMTRNKNGNVEFQYPTEIIHQNYKGSMYQLKNRAIDLLITPNHNVFIKRQRNNSAKMHFELAPIREVAHLQNAHFNRDVFWKGQDLDCFYLPPIKGREFKRFEMDSWLEFLGYYLSEGSLNYKKKHSIYLVRLAQSKEIHPEIFEKMKNCVKRLGYNFYENDQAIEISNKQLYEYCKQFGNAHEKYIPREFLVLPPSKLCILLNSLLAGDGYKRESRSVYKSVSKRLADDVQELAIKAGYCASISIHEQSASFIKGRKIQSESPCYCVNISEFGKEPRINHGKKDWDIIEWNGIVHCVEVPNHIILIRRKGKAIWCGNSKGWSSMLQRAEYARRFKQAEEKGLKCVLLYCGDHDPDGLRISDFLRSNLRDLKNIRWNDGVKGYDPSDLTIDRFGLNYDFIIANNLTWIDNLITGSGKNLASPAHPNHFQYYVQDYLKQYGARKCEANSLVVIPDRARQLCRESIEKYLGDDALERFADKREEVAKELEDFRESTGIGEAIKKAIKQIQEEK